MPAYLPIIKQWHIAFALMSLSGFFLRGMLMWRQSSWMQHGVVRRLPHVIDSMLFLLGLILLCSGPWTLSQASWLQAKLGALLVYIGLGFIALNRRGFSPHTRIIAWFAALSVFAYIFFVAITKQPWLS